MLIPKLIDYNTVSHNIYSAGFELHDERNDDVIRWNLKQDLYRIKFLIDQILTTSDKFQHEEEFLINEREKVRWGIKNDIQQS